MKIKIISGSQLRPAVVGQASRLSSSSSDFEKYSRASGLQLDRRDAYPTTREGGSITIIFVMLLTIMLILVTAESRALFNLHREVKFLEQQQIKRLAAPTTNAVASVSPLKK